MISAKACATKLTALVRDDEAATAAEYGILAALVAVAIIGAVSSFGTSLTNMFRDMTGHINAHS